MDKDVLDRQRYAYIQIDISYIEDKDRDRDVVIYIPLIDKCIRCICRYAQIMQIFRRYNGMDTALQR